MIQLRDLEYHIKDNPVLNGITVSLHDMEITGICGPAGAGKSALLNILNGNITGYAGSVRLDEYELRLLGKDELNRKSALCHARWDNINYESTLYNFILQGLSFYRRIFIPFDDVDRDAAESLIHELMLQPYSGLKLKNIPDSVLQTGKIARALAGQSPIILLDTPDLFLNMNQRKTLYRTLKKYVSSGRRTILIASGDINFLSNICDRIIFMDRGGIIEDRTPGELSAGSIKKIFGTDALMIKNIITGKNEFQIIVE